MLLLCNYKTGESVLFDGQQIQLIPGFKATASGTGYFKAYIDGCGGSFTTIADNAAAQFPENKKIDIAIETSKETLDLCKSVYQINLYTIMMVWVIIEKASIEVFSITGNRVAVLQQPNNITKGKHNNGMLQIFLVVCI